MSDNVIVSENVGIGATVATDDIGGVQHQRVKMVLGDDAHKLGAWQAYAKQNHLPVKE